MFQLLSSGACSGYSGKGGEDVKEGQTVAQMKTSEIETIQSQVADAVEIARSQMDKIDRGVEPEVLASAKIFSRLPSSRWI